MAKYTRFLVGAVLLLGLALTFGAAKSAPAANAAMASVTNTSTWTQAPVIIQVSEGVKPGDVLSLYGEGLLAGQTTVTFHPLRGIDQQLPVVQDEAAGQFARVLLPTNLSPEDATITVQNPYGSTKVVINQVIPTWLSDEVAYPGLHLQLFGRNLDTRAFHGRGQTQVRLVKQDTNAVANHDDDAIVIDPAKVTAYAVDFTVPRRARPGSYTVQVRNSEQAPWATMPGGNLPIVAAKAHGDPLGLNVSWSQDFNWNKVYNVRHYGAVGNGVTDDTAAIQAGIEDVANKGGGVLFFPNGTYTFTHLAIRSGVVLEGQSRTGVTLQYAKTGTGGPSAVVREGDAITKGLFGVANMTFILQPGTVLTSRLIMLDFEIPRSNYFNLPDDQQTSTRMFVDAVTVNESLTDTHVGPACIIDGKDQVLFANDYFKGFAAVTFDVFLLHGATMRNNTIEYASGAPSNATSNFIFEGNHLIGHYIASVYTQSSLHGVEESINMRPVTNLYWANNVIENFNTPLTGNDGESMFVETGGGDANLMEGQIASATTTTATVNPLCTLPGESFDTAVNGGSAQWEIMITGGRGLGEERSIVSHNGNTVTLDQPWSVIPDQSSQFTILHLATDVVMDHNTIQNNRSAMLLYMNTYDAVIANTTSVDTMGIFGKSNAVTYNSSSTQACYINPVYFSHLVGNTLVGPSPTVQDSWMGLSGFSYFNNGSGFQPVPTILMYGNEFRDNSIDRTGFSNVADHTNGWGSEQAPAGFEAAFQTATTGDGIVATLFDNDAVANSQDGIHLGSGVDSTLLYKNPMTNVQVPFYDTGSTNTVSIP